MDQSLGVDVAAIERYQYVHATQDINRHCSATTFDKELEELSNSLLNVEVPYRVGHSQLRERLQELNIWYVHISQRSNSRLIHMESFRIY